MKKHLTPALQMGNRDGQGEEVEIGDTVSYGATYKAKEPQWWLLYL